MPLSSFVKVSEPDAPPVQEEDHAWNRLGIQPLWVEADDIDEEKYRLHRGRRTTVILLGLLLILVAAAGAFPAAREWVDFWRESGAPPGRWVFLLTFVSVMQIAYGIYVSQFPDWSAVRVASLFLLAVAVGYSTLAGLAAIPFSRTAALAYLELAGRYQQHEVAGWSFCLLCINGMLSYLIGKLATRWQQVTR